MKTTIAILALGLLATAAHAQPANQVGAVLMCPSGGADGQGNPLVAPCGGQGVPPVQVYVVAPMPAQQVTACRANPLTGRSPPLC